MPEDREMHRLGKLCDMCAIYLTQDVIFIWGRNKQLLSGYVHGENLITDAKKLIHFTHVVEQQVVDDHGGCLHSSVCKVLAPGIRGFTLPPPGPDGQANGYASIFLKLSDLASTAFPLTNVKGIPLQYYRNSHLCQVITVFQELIDRDYLKNPEKEQVLRPGYHGSGNKRNDGLLPEDSWHQGEFCFSKVSAASKIQTFLGYLGLPILGGLGYCISLPTASPYVLQFDEKEHFVLLEHSFPTITTSTSSQLQNHNLETTPTQGANFCSKTIKVNNQSNCINLVNLDDRLVEIRFNFPNDNGNIANFASLEIPQDSAVTYHIQVFSLAAPPHRVPGNGALRTGKSQTPALLEATAFLTRTSGLHFRDSNYTAHTAFKGFRSAFHNLERDLALPFGIRSLAQIWLSHGCRMAYYVYSHHIGIMVRKTRKGDIDKAKQGTSCGDEDFEIDGSILECQTIRYQTSKRVPGSADDMGEAAQSSLDPGVPGLRPSDGTKLGKAA
ncbi:hypothetical protein MJG53_012585 [Ovis ammon polii x Ovis aries]|uniref:Uncharacterized protein n=1 Tax=Ovis ammon polii x Ovis aries TaxID=2918886 RepID=A0ACB9UL83_9CETA|nr:hypothetical protein MJG53_012585 [Ovis ammon polii x Ovis aries]